MQIDWTTVRALTFDCYGTLIDWEAGLLRDLRTGLSAVSADDAELLAAYARAESAVEAGTYRPYREVLVECITRVAADVGARVVDADALGRGLPTWPPFADTRESLQALGELYRLCIVSNIDRDLFAGTEDRLGAKFAEIVTADQVRSYKPAAAHLEEAQRRLDLPRDSIVHVAQSLFHDIEPAHALGFATVWVDRRAGRAGGATPPPRGSPVPDQTVRSLAELAALPPSGTPRRRALAR